MKQQEKHDGVPRILVLTVGERRAFFEAVGRMMFNALPASIQCGHRHPRSTIHDYFRKGYDEGFLVDFFRMDGKSLTGKWIGATSSSDPVMINFSAAVCASPARRGRGQRGR